MPNEFCDDPIDDWVDAVTHRIAAPLLLAGAGVIGMSAGMILSAWLTAIGATTVGAAVWWMIERLRSCDTGQLGLPGSIADHNRIEDRRNQY